MDPMVEKNVFFMTFSLSVICENDKVMLILQMAGIGDTEIEIEIDINIINGMK